MVLNHVTYDFHSNAFAICLYLLNFEISTNSTTNAARPSYDESSADHTVRQNLEYSRIYLLHATLAVASAAAGVRTT